METTRLSADHLLLLFSCKSNLTVSSPALQLITAPHLQWVTQNFPILTSLLPPQIALSQPPTLAVNPQASDHSARRAQGLTTELHLLSPFPHLIYSSLEDPLLWPLLTPWPHSHGTKSILVKHTAFLLLWSLSASTPSPSSFPSVSFQYLEIHFTWNPQWPHLKVPQKSFFKATQSCHILLRNR